MCGVIAKIIGCMAIGLILGGGWGLVVGAVVGGIWVSNSMQVELRTMRNTGLRRRKFFESTFLLAGHVAQADGRIAPEEVECVQLMLRQLGVAPEYNAAAMEYFERGIQPDFDFEACLEDLAQACGSSGTLVAPFIEIQIAVACADGDFSLPEREVIRKCCARLGFPESRIEGIAHRYLGRAHYEERAEQRTAHEHHVPEDLKWACEVLGVEPETPWDEVRRGYARKMREFHPDKLVSKGLPEEFLEFANKRTKEFTRAYQILKKRHQS